MQMSPIPQQSMPPSRSSTLTRPQPSAASPTQSSPTLLIPPSPSAPAHPPAPGLAPDPIEHLWEQVLARDPHARFVYAVRTTGIFCRPSCPSRRPKRPNVEFFPDPQTATVAGFRACLRCRPHRQLAEAALVERLVAYLKREHERTVPLSELARIAGCTPGTVQRLFTRVVGLSPRAWTNARRAETYRNLLSAAGAGPSPTDSRIIEAIYAAGFSGPSRAHAAAPLGMQARRFRAQGAGEHIGYAIADAPLPSITSGKQSRMLVASTARGVCAIFLGDEDASLAAELARRFPRAELAPNTNLAPQVAAILAHLNEHPSAASLPLDLRGTAFQARVWAALQAIPRGTTCTYAQLAAAIGSPKAVRAVGTACGQNPASILVPCHRVVGSDGKLTGYRWGLERKRALLALERGPGK
jgi:AraC family transcriptional regulator of adaptative response/methylated-DNA-[protein]-cysteine methyltransferase